MLETKHFSEGVSINEQGEFSIWFAGKPRGIPSPLEQNDRHIAVLQDVFKTLDMPTRLGIRLQPSFEQALHIAAQKSHELIAVVPSYCADYAARHHPDLIPMPLPLEESLYAQLEIAFILLWHKRHNQDAKVMWLRNETKRLYGQAAQGLALDFGGEGGARTLWLLPASDPALAPPDADADRRWFAADLAHGLPRLPVDPEARRVALGHLGDAYPGTFGQRLQGVLNNPVAASDEDACWAVNSLTHTSTQLDPESREVLSRLIWGGDG